MQATVTRKELKQATTGFSKIKPAKYIEILNHVKVEITPGEAKLTFTDLEETITYTMPAETKDTGTFLVSLVDLKNMVKGKDISISFTPHSKGEGEDKVCTVDIEYDGITQTLQSLDPEECPPSIKTSNAKLSKSPGFLDAYRFVSSFASTDETRYTLNGCYWDADKMIATDGRRLTAIDCTKPKALKENIIIKTSKFLLKTKLANEHVAIVENKGIKALFLHAGPWQYIGKLIEGKYPNYQQVIPKEGKHCIKIGELDASRLHGILEGPAKQHERAQAIEFENGKLTAFADALQIALVDSVVPTEPAAYNWAYFCDALDAGFRKFRYEDSLTPALSKTGNALHVLMPMRPTGKK